MRTVAIPSVSLVSALFLASKTEVATCTSPLSFQSSVIDASVRASGLYVDDSPSPCIFQLHMET